MTLEEMIQLLEQMRDENGNVFVENERGVVVSCRVEKRDGSIVVVVG